MKIISKLIALIIVICFTTSVYSQSDTKDYFSKKHEINLGVSNLFAKNKTMGNYYYPYYYDSSIPYPYPYYSDNYMEVPAFGVGYRYHFKKNALRANFNIASQNSKVDNSSGASTNTTTQNNLWYEVKIGYEIR